LDRSYPRCHIPPLPALRTLCLDDRYATRSRWGSKFPHALERLTVWQCRWRRPWPPQDETTFVFNCLDIPHILHMADEAPNLKHIRIRGQEDVWARDREIAVKLCEDARITLELSIFNRRDEKHLRWQKLG